MREQLIKQLEKYVPYNQQEQQDKETILQQLKTVDDIFYRENVLQHMTASGWVVNPARDKVLMAYHNIYQSYSWLGGHADGDEDLLQVALKEVQEESGIKNVRALSDEILSIEILTVDGHEKRGKHVSSHLHLNITYLIEADDSQQLLVAEDENSDVKWFGIDEAVESSNEQWFKDNIYSKLNEKLKSYILTEKI